MDQSEQKRYIGQKIRYWRKKRMYTQNQLADLTGISRVMICYIETGRTNPKATDFGAIAHALEVNPAELLPSVGGKE